MTMQSTAVLRQLAREREATLRATALHLSGEHRRRRVRQWFGRQLVRTGTWLADEQPMRPAGVR